MKHYDPTKRRICDRKWCRKTGTETMVVEVKANLVLPVSDQEATVELMVFYCPKHYREQIG